MKVAIINRGISGSGKSTFNNILKEKGEKHGQKVIVHSTDDFFMKDGKYVFNIKALGYNHKQNYEAFVESLRKNVNIVVCDNTNSKQWEYKNYACTARNKGYTVIGVVFYPDVLKKHLERNTHGLTEEILSRQKHNLESNLETSFVDDSFKIMPESFFDDIDKVAQAIIGKNIF